MKQPGHGVTGPRTVPPPRGPPGAETWRIAARPWHYKGTSLPPGMPAMNAAQLATIVLGLLRRSAAEAGAEGRDRPGPAGGPRRRGAGAHRHAGGEGGAAGDGRRGHRAGGDARREGGPGAPRRAGVTSPVVSPAVFT